MREAYSDKRTPKRCNQRQCLRAQLLLQQLLSTASTVSTTHNTALLSPSSTSPQVHSLLRVLQQDFACQRALTTSQEARLEKLPWMCICRIGCLLVMLHLYRQIKGCTTPLLAVCWYGGLAEDLDAAELFAADTGVHHEAWEALLCLQRLDRENAFLYGAVPFNEKDVFGCTEEEAAARRSVLDKQLQVMKERYVGRKELANFLVLRSSFCFFRAARRLLSPSLHPFLSATLPFIVLCLILLPLTGGWSVLQALQQSAHRGSPVYRPGEHSSRCQHLQ